ncbi:MAG: SDR family NAD(P)-dependent oxidoreductase [Planctomycetaceae bacterium]|jgi:all-trans-retinol dehydrogenase (NAD+)|nr:SDR family NAD(P)-dependent oxidoreductase [Planctomycetaceae bacterium]MDA0919719.1 SDR family NAD(P)-dependent oxidoreductase [Planctomycetota bacterium]MDA1160530.1 SDR family NAD(P)-dependent oxidoreductase [Planctomycetota bacterium]
MKNLKSRRVLITGAGHGLGLATAKAFAKAGAFVIITDRESERVTEAVCELQIEALPCAGYVMDVTDPADVRHVRDQIHADHGPINILVNNAGIVSGGQFLEVPLEKHLFTYDVNTHGPVIVTHLFLQDLIDSDEGHIVNIASASALIALPNAATYASSKWAVLGFTDSLREELELTGRGHVGVSVICPSYISTGMFEGVKAPLLTPVLTPESLAAKIVRCVQKRKTHLLTPWLVGLIPLGKATWPRAVFRRLLRFLGVYQGMQSWKGHAAAPAEPPKKDGYIRVAS